MLLTPLWISVLALPGLDYRFGWSPLSLGGVPVWLELASLAVALGCWILVFEVFRFNSFASTAVRVGAGQKVVSDGPYRIVRHPMYFAIVVLALATPLALGSYFAIPAAALFIPLLAFRLVHEERVLRRELPGYAEYCRHTRFRLIPFAF
jgi:protein-S-isoprenylcysteine O-methyltransferase Ste14